ncbi:MAG: DUF4126 family protein [Chloroflexi bacterium]|nr:DUF4126 family protein [Chloroflexota bacterium]
MLHFLRIIGLGLLTGSRTLAVLATLSSRLAQQQSSGVTGSLCWLTNRWAARLLQIMAAGELVADKVPDIPSRTESGPLVGRTLVGALTGTLYCAAQGRSRVVGALLGAVSAAAGAFVGYHLRRNAVEESGLPDPLVALIEDSIVLSGARVLLCDVDVDSETHNPAAR